MAAKKATPGTVVKMLKQRDELDRRIGRALGARVTGLTASADGREPITVSHTAALAVRMVKNGVVYSFALNLRPLPFQESGLYPFRLQPNTSNALLWTVFQSKTPWAYQIDLIVNDQVVLLDRRSSGGGDKLSLTDQQVIIAE
jgi:hypothetical protein